MKTSRFLSAATLVALAAPTLFTDVSHAQRRGSSRAQEAPAEKAAAPKAMADKLPERRLPADSAMTTEAEVMIGGERVPYQVTLGTQPVYGHFGIDLVFSICAAIERI